MLKKAADIQKFLNVTNPLLRYGKVKIGFKILPDDPIAKVVNKLTKKRVMEVEFDHRTSTWNVYPDGPIPNEINEQ